MFVAVFLLSVPTSVCGSTSLLNSRMVVLTSRCGGIITDVKTVHDLTNES